MIPILKTSLSNSPLKSYWIKFPFASFSYGRPFWRGLLTCQGTPPTSPIQANIAWLVYNIRPAANGSLRAFYGLLWQFSVMDFTPFFEQNKKGRTHQGGGVVPSPWQADGLWRICASGIKSRWKIYNACSCMAPGHSPSMEGCRGLLCWTV